MSDPTTPPPAGTPQPAGSPLLEVRNLATGYGDLRVIWDVSFSVAPGKLSALLGRNGAGKTTVLRAVAGLNRVQGGSITFKGEDISRLSVHRRVRAGIGMVQENKRIFRRRTIEENLLLGGYTLKLRGKKLRAELDRIYQLFPVLGRRASTLAGSLSGGQQQMLAIGQALMPRPSLLMLDEPSAGLAPSIVAEVMDTVGALKETDLGILLVEQAVEAAMGVADHVTVLDVGKVVMDGDAKDIDDMSVLRDAYFGHTAGQGDGGDQDPAGG
ncbi:MAG TPA: ABC transporter ATP-binding protein [Acidimicrobiales bacterium]|nr:ABC transporter ATP-binding protein [Acidimicrobiales bacterium]